MNPISLGKKDATYADAAINGASNVPKYHNKHGISGASYKRINAPRRYLMPGSLDPRHCSDAAGRVNVL